MSTDRRLPTDKISKFQNEIVLSVFSHESAHCNQNMWSRLESARNCDDEILIKFIGKMLIAEPESRLFALHTALNVNDHVWTKLSVASYNRPKMISKL